MSLMKGAGANILRGVAGAGVLAGFDKFQQMYNVHRLQNRGLGCVVCFDVFLCKSFALSFKNILMIHII